MFQSREFTEESQPSTAAEAAATDRYGKTMETSGFTKLIELNIFLQSHIYLSFFWKTWSQFYCFYNRVNTIFIYQ